jgi:endonuclease/exonuclease/phosphatase family metal-dependent hydrolase
MPAANTFRIATFNAENLFRRAKALNLKDSDKTDAIMAQVKSLATLLAKATYSAEDKAAIWKISAELNEYITIREDLGTFGQLITHPTVDKAGYKVSAGCKGRGSWSGEIEFKTEPFSDEQRKNTARVIKEMKADVQCLIEVESMPAVRSFNTDALGGMFNEFVVIDNVIDPRGIDVGCLSKYPILGVRSHMFEKLGGKYIWSRDCLEVLIQVPFADKKPLWVFCNHFKSQRGKTQQERDDAAAKRRGQANRVAELLKQRNLAKEYVVVLGDLNEDVTNDYQSLKPLLDVPNLHSVFDLNTPPDQRWTHYYEPEKNKPSKGLSTLDYILVSKPLKAKMTSAGFERRGMDVLANITNGAEKPFDTVTSWSNAASDHAGVWAEFKF